MSTASPVPETHDRRGDDPRDTLQRLAPGVIARTSFERMRAADGFSHARALAFQLVLTLIPGAVVLVALAARMQWASLSDALVRSVESVTPGPTGDVLRDALDQGDRAAGNTAAIVLGVVALLVSGTTAFGQLERTANRLYGIETDRPPRQKYARAFVLVLSAGTLVGCYLAAIGLGSGWGSGWGSASDGDDPSLWWSLGRWPLGALCLALALLVVFRACPRRRQPGWSWLAVGALLTLAGIVLVSLVLSVYVEASGSFGDTYGPLAGVFGLLLWCYLVTLTTAFGLSFTAQLEAVRAGVLDVRSAVKVEAGEPDTATLSYGAALTGAATGATTGSDDERVPATIAAAARVPAMDGRETR